MKHKPKGDEPPLFIGALLKHLPKSLRAGPILVAAAAYVFSLAVILGNVKSSLGALKDPENFEVGRVAEYDVIAEHAVTYEDKEASRARLEAEERLVQAVFLYSREITEEIREAWRRAAAEKLAASPDMEALLTGAGAVLDAVLERGVFALPGEAAKNLNRDEAELIRRTASRTERELVRYSEVVTMDKAEAALEREARKAAALDLAALAPALLLPFIKENVLFSPEETSRRLAETRAKVEPVLKYIEPGKRVIKKGFIITDEEMAELRALNMSLPGNDWRNLASLALFVTFVFVFLAIYCAKGFYIGRPLRDAEAYLISALAALYMGMAVLVRSVSFGWGSTLSALVMPTALVVMLPSILINRRIGLVLALTLPLGAFLTGYFDTPSYVFALVSGVTASFTLQDADKRMDLIKAGLILALANCLAMIAILLGGRAAADAYGGNLFWAAFNGFLSGMLVLGFLPPLEHALNAATAYRLRELSDLNTPILRRLFTAAPGTYSHSIMVANLAEAACQDIGANALLARVSAYYHDLGKMENPEYFVENQTDHNRHDELAPRLSATIIRSHVKLGLEKARQLGLPREVQDIISEHHGNSIIQWFYNKALRQEELDPNKAEVNPEDFSYPGSPPRSRESAVVMLADMTEAAVRTLDKPTVPRLEKFIQELFKDKVDHGQLARSELTFKDLEIIKNAFVRVLVGYYHSRIEYPKSPRDVPKETIKDTDK